MMHLVPLLVNDLKLVYRDPSLRIFLVMPLLIFLVVLLALPALISSNQALSRFVPVILMGATLQTSTMFGFIYSMVLVDEKDLKVAQVYGILPISKTRFVIARLAFPCLFSSIVTFGLLVTQPFFIFGIWQMIILSLLCGLVTIVLTLVVSSFSSNKMEGMTWFKLVNLIITLPLAAYFIPAYKDFFSVIPTYWVYQTLNGMIHGDPLLWPLMIGYGFTIVLIYFLGRRFEIVHFR